MQLKSTKIHLLYHYLRLWSYCGHPVKWVLPVLFCRVFELLKSVHRARRRVDTFAEHGGAWRAEIEVDSPLAFWSQDLGEFRTRMLQCIYVLICAYMCLFCFAMLCQAVSSRTVESPVVHIPSTSDSNRFQYAKPTWRVSTFVVDVRMHLIRGPVRECFARHKLGS